MVQHPDQRRFAIAVSFPGEHRRFVRQVVDRLAQVLGRDRVFYDAWYEAELLGLDGDLKLRRYYREQSDLVVPFFSEHYAKDWCQIEWSAIRAMLKDRRKDDAVVPVQMDGTRVDGWEDIDFAVRRKNRTGKEIAELLLQAYRHRHPDETPRQTAAELAVGAGTAGDLTAGRIGDANYTTAADSVMVRWTDELASYGEGFAGRTDELKMLDDAWNGGAVRVVVFHAEGGAGKTRLLVQWLNRLRDDGWRGAGRVFVQSFYSQGNRDKGYASSDLFFEHALAWFGYRGQRITDARERGQTLARLVVQQQGLLVLDGLEPLQHPAAFNEGHLRDPGIEQLLLALASMTGGRPHPALCVVTSRQPLVELRDRVGRAVVQQPLDRLDRDAGADLLRQLEVRGTGAELFAAVDEYQGHAYSLMLLGTWLRDATTDHDIRRRHEIPLLDEDRQHGSHADQLFGAYGLHLGMDSAEVTLLRLLGLFDRAAKRDLIDVLCQSRGDALDALTAPLRGLSPADWNRLLGRLRKLRLIVLADDHQHVDSHPLLREYFGARLRKNDENAFRAAHWRLFDHLCETTEHRPDGLDGLQPLYQAVVHGCLAGRQQEACDKVYIDRILRGTGHGGFYSTKKLGAIAANLAAVAAFFDEPWSRVSPNLREAYQAWLLNEAAFRLRALGRLTEALQPMRAGLEMRIQQEVWTSAARIAGNFSELEVTLGRLPEAVADARQAITYADQSGDAFLRMAFRATAADALHQSGERLEAGTLLAEAERMQQERQPQFDLLYSLPGFRYCDWLLAPAERAAWGSILYESFNGKPQATVSPRADAFGLPLNEDERTAALDACAAVERRANWCFETRAPTDSVLDIALDHLTLARVGLVRAILTHGLPQPTLDLPHVAAAVNGLRGSGNMNDLPKALLTAAWYHFVRGELDQAKQWLDEAQQIAERGPMPLYLADILLHRARLFGSLKGEGRSVKEAEYPWPDRTPRADLAEARKLIEQHGYWRRKEELEDAEAALGSCEASFEKKLSGDA
jgi:tetratricopeptide (TPR) repeat protein